MYLANTILSTDPQGPCQPDRVQALRFELLGVLVQHVEEAPSNRWESSSTGYLVRCHSRDQPQNGDCPSASHCDCYCHHCCSCSRHETEGATKSVRGNGRKRRTIQNGLDLTTVLSQNSRNRIASAAMTIGVSPWNLTRRVAVAVAVLVVVEPARFFPHPNEPVAVVVKVAPESLASESSSDAIPKDDYSYSIPPVTPHPWRRIISAWWRSTASRKSARPE